MNLKETLQKLKETGEITQSQYMSMVTKAAREKKQAKDEAIDKLLEEIQKGLFMYNTDTFQVLNPFLEKTAAIIKEQQ